MTLYGLLTLRIIEWLLYDVLDTKIMNPLDQNSKELSHSDGVHSSAGMSFLARPHPLEVMSLKYFNTKSQKLD